MFQMNYEDVETWEWSEAPAVVVRLTLIMMLPMLQLVRMPKILLTSLFIA